MKWQPCDIIVGMLAATLSVGLLMTALGNNLLGIEVTADRKEVISLAVGGAISIISLYVGAKIKP